MRQRSHVVDGFQAQIRRRATRLLLIGSTLGGAALAATPAAAQSCPPLPMSVTTTGTTATVNGTANVSGGSLSLIRCTQNADTTVYVTSTGPDGPNGSTHHVFGTAQGGGNGTDGGNLVIANLQGSPLAGQFFGNTITAISRGGNGGAGGDTSVAGSGGTGGLGGNGGSVTVINGDTIASSGGNSTAIVAQSIGGASGPGGTGGVIIGSGGSAAGAGNSGKDVLVVNQQTGIINAFGGGGGISAVSMGGTGGEGGASRGLFYAHGGNGARGGDAGGVEVWNAGTITSNYAGITALSVGGGGGDGGGAVSYGLYGGVAIGGYGGAGGNSGAVWVHQVGTINTLNIDGAGVKASSIAGGGGSGATGSSYTLGAGGDFALAMGGSGGVGGSASSAEIDQEAGSVVRTGVTTSANGYPIFPWGIPQGSSLDFSTGLLAQSIGGGGGSGGQALSVATSVPDEGISLAVGVSLGGAGAKGGAAGTAKVVSLGSIDTGWGRFSPAIVAQSIGGGGGSGGNALSVDQSVNLIGSDSKSATVDVTLAGSGGNGGTAGAAIVKQAGTAITRGHLSGGILAQSIAGGGGNGGHTFDVASSIGGNSAAIGVSMGGNGGTGGTAGTSDIQMLGGSSVTTLGNLSSGILSQSIAGGGGNGGSVHSYAIAVQGGSGRALAANVAMGGKGGIGGAGNTATASVAGTIQTYGSLSAGALVQSIGGGGGNGGHAFALSGAASFDSGSFGSDGQALAATVTMGGSGGAGSDGGAAGFALDGGSINTAGLLSAGVAVQSIGGGGGHGGTAQSFTVASGVPTDLAGGFNRSTDALVGIVREQYSASPNINASVDIGGSGGSGGRGGSVEVSLTGGTVTTTGAMSDGILAQSLGGGGGAGGDAVDDGFSGVGAYTLSLNVGGGAGSGQSGGFVNVENQNDNSRAATVSTSGLQSYGVLAQSIGGGGGKGGSAHTAFTSIIGISGSTITATIGGKGGSGSSGGQVNVGDLNIKTSGIQGNGIVAQSIGGGGGNGNVSQASGAFGLSFGSGGGSGSNGGQVNVRNASIQTSGAQAIGVIAQSVGGGGGHAGLGQSGSVATHITNVVTEKVKSLDFTVNGGGGSGGNVFIGCGGDRQTNCGLTVQTSGDQATGIVAQSIGGSGGTSQAAQMFSDAKTLTIDQSKVAQSGSGTVSITDTTNPGDQIQVITTGNNAIGILAQSFDNGGSAHWVDGAVPTVTGTFGSEWSSANGGVLVDLNGFVSTQGANSHGLVVQALSNAATVQTDSGLVTYGGAMLDAATVAVTLRNNASISTSGANAAGIQTLTNGNSASALTLAQFGTAAAATKTRAQDVVISSGATVNTSGANSWAIDMHNGPWGITQPLDQINTHLLVADGATVQSTGAGSGGIRVIDSGNTVVEILGSVSAPGEAVHVEARNATLYVPYAGEYSSGRITGDVYLKGVGDNATVQINPGQQFSGQIQGKLTVLNMLGGGTINVGNVGNPYGIFPGNNVTLPVSGQRAITVDNSISSIRVGLAYGDIVNISSGAQAAPPVALTVGNHIGSITGNFALTYGAIGSGALTIDGTRGTVDSIQVTQMNAGGPTANCLNGYTCSIDLIMTSLPVGTWTPQTLVRVDRGFATLGSAASMFGIIPGSQVVQYDIGTAINPDGSATATLNGFSIDFTRATDAGSNLAAVAQIANSQISAYQQGATLPDTSSPLYYWLVQGLQAEGRQYVQQELTKLEPSLHYGASSAASEATQQSAAAMQSCGGAGGAVANPLSQGNCYWAKFIGHDSSRNNVGQDYHSRGVAIGRQWPVGNDVYVGLSGHFATTEQASAVSKADGERGGLGAIVKLVRGNRFGSLALTASRDAIDGERRVQDAVLGELRATMSQKVDVYGAHARLGQRFVSGPLDVIARADLSAALVRDHGYTERGGGIYNLRVDPETSTLLGVHPVVQAGARTRVGKLPVRLYGEAGRRWTFGTLRTHAALASGFNSAFAADIAHDTDKAMMTYGAGLTTQLNSRVELRLNYDRTDGKIFDSDEFGIKAAVHF